MVERLVLAVIVLAPALASAGAKPTVSVQEDGDSHPLMAAAAASAADAQPAPATQVEPPPATAIPLAPPSMTAPHDPATTRPATSSQWYGWQILISDAAVFSFALTGNASAAYVWVGSGAIVHFGHGNVGRGIASAALRVGLPLLGLSAGMASARGCQGDWCGAGEVIAGALIGMGSAELIDVALLARESAPSPAAVRAAQHSHGVEVSPVVRAGRSGVGLDLVGRF
jgi:hypothetical protein